MIRWVMSRGLQLLVLTAVVALLAGQLLGQPVLLGFVETGSMEPTIETGDGFVAVPSQLVGEPEPGDVVVFDAQEIEGGGLTTHRVVDETDTGYVTQGDANPFTDQDSAEPPVQDAQVVATALQVDGSVVTINSLGTAVMTIGETLERGQTWLAATFGVRSFLGTTGLAYLLLGLSVVLYALETIRERRDRSPRDGGSDSGERALEELDPRLLAAGFALVVVVAASAAMLVPAGTHSYDVVSAEFESDRPLVIEQGTTEEIPHEIPNGGFVPIVSYVEPGSGSVGVDLESTTVGPRSEGETTVAIEAPEETGYYPTYVTEHRYLYVLPAPVLDVLYDVHPWVPFVAINAILGGGLYLLGRYLLGPADPRARRATIRERGPRRSILRRLY
ncbi:signal peptidase I [Natrarchaeobaculum sulfurireducens]|nr:signal peptidase I [Natrarchaeobaculum sulfurireducens]